ncbi:hypothetical protein CEXT_565671 [Caerostris extrusa]|uniref:Uncharacterized protein n=1 Tax=Caerostris extrusa TaxID=172846 RepID=A0AAV4VDS9_CAEEX|nr:hypothetical protein CEXT_565671 [Caerostris extrusa]
MAQPFENVRLACVRERKQMKLLLRGRRQGWREKAGKGRGMSEFFCSKFDFSSTGRESGERISSTKFALLIRVAHLQREKKNRVSLRASVTERTVTEYEKGNFWERSFGLCAREEANEITSREREDREGRKGDVGILLLEI